MCDDTDLDLLLSIFDGYNNNLPVSHNQNNIASSTNETRYINIQPPEYSQESQLKQQEHTMAKSEHEENFEQPCPSPIKVTTSTPGVSKKKTKSKRIRTAYTSDQLLALEEAFEGGNYLCRQRRIKLAGDLKLNEKQVKVWFQNRRMKLKKEKNNGGNKTKLADTARNHKSESTLETINSNNMIVDNLSIEATAAKNNTLPILPDYTNQPVLGPNAQYTDTSPNDRVFCDSFDSPCSLQSASPMHQLQQMQLPRSVPQEYTSYANHQQHLYQHAKSNCYLPDFSNNMIVDNLSIQATSAKNNTLQILPDCTDKPVLGPNTHYTDTSQNDRPFYIFDSHSNSQSALPMHQLQLVQLPRSAPQEYTSYANHNYFQHAQTTSCSTPKNINSANETISTNSLSELNELPSWFYEDNNIEQQLDMNNAVPIDINSTNNQNQIPMLFDL